MKIFDGFCYFSSLFLIGPGEDGKESYFQSSYYEESHGCSDEFDNRGYEKGTKRSASEEYKGIKSHDASKVFLGRGHLDGGIAVDEEKSQ